MNTNVNTVVNTNAAMTLNLEFNPELLTDKEKSVIEPSWDGECAVLKDLPLPKDVKVAVHDGEFHSDDVMCVALLRIFAGFDPIEDRIIRTRDKALLQQADLRLDVGSGLLDHHNERSAGYGLCAASRVFALLRQSGCFSKYDARIVEKLAGLIDKVAAVDTGDPSATGHWIIEMVQAFNRHGVVSGRDHFELAVDHVTDAVVCLLETWEAAIDAERAAMDAIRRSIDSNQPEIVDFPVGSRAANCKRLIHDHAPQAIYFVSPEVVGGALRSWRVLCAADPDREFEDEKSLTFSNRKKIPAKFCGLEYAALDAATGIAGGIFSHKDGFIAGFKTHDAAVEFAKLCLAS